MQTTTHGCKNLEQTGDIAILSCARGVFDCLENRGVVLYAKIARVLSQMPVFAGWSSEKPCTDCLETAPEGVLNLSWMLSS